MACPPVAVVISLFEIYAAYTLVFFVGAATLEASV